MRISTPLQKSRGYTSVIVLLVLGIFTYLVLSGNGRPLLDKVITWSEEPTIKEAIRKDCEVDKTHATNKDANYRLRAFNNLEVKGSFARVSEGCVLENDQSGSGATAILKKTNTEWKIVDLGQELPSKTKGQELGLPDGWFSTAY